MFMGEESHLSHVRSWLRGWTVTAPINWRVMEIEDPSAPYITGTFQRVLVYRAPLHFANDIGDALVVYCSTAPKGLLLLKLMLLGRRSPKDVLALFHNQLARLLPFSVFNELNLMFSLPQPRALTFLVLGESIREAVTQLVRFRPGGLGAIDQPSLLATRALDVAQQSSGLRFGFLGVSLNKGFDEFILLARRLRASGASVRYSMVGTINHPANVVWFQDVLPDASSTPITAEEYQRRAEALTYVVWTAAPRDYDLRASATFVDAMCFGKPGIYLRNRYVEHYFHRFGDIGYLCDDVESMYGVMKEVSDRFPRERYLEQTRNIAVARGCFSPERVGGQLRNILTT